MQIRNGRRCDASSAPLWGWFVGRENGDTGVGALGAPATACNLYHTHTHSKHRKLTGWHHVREATQGKFATEWNYTRLTPAECVRVSDECWRWLETQDS